ncbi:MAG: SUMF1/EgtB/PvdO family nonheme iron enzyme [Gammaproteobacteria bacterium]|jgi:formylglycine-generating enzyme required for sulfatase activity|nr:SUMF1/EgtB/PvdO family nonheme iron enzyme [Gammaproteobacteria bacterium]MDP6731652.1 SUMF1/EgtB/PvdO family nonheme iron enzyme [Gammaproteobacteria bacterium]
MNQTEEHSEKVPGRTVGFTVMTLVILLAAFQMIRESSLQQMQDSGEVETNTQPLEGFRPAAWHLPDDELLGFVEIPAGPFVMGSNPALDPMAYENERWSNLRRQGSVDLPAFYVSRYEVTRAQFALFTEDSRVNADDIDLAGAGDLPVTGITWPEALAYGRWLEQRLRESPQTPAEISAFLEGGAHVTLPNEAEWEKAARGTDGRVFTWGPRLRNDLANFGGEALAAVGAIACSTCSYGLSDMAGNVWELTRSPSQDYPYDPSGDATNLPEDALYVMRGGSYADVINNVRTAVRGAADPGVRNGTIGFRLVISTL